MSGMMLAEQGIQQIVDHAWVWFIAPIGAILALLFAFIFSKTVMRRSEGEENMIQIAEAVRKGAMAYLIRQYKVVFVVFVVLVLILLGLGLLNIQPIWTSLGGARSSSATSSAARRRRACCWGWCQTQPPSRSCAARSSGNGSFNIAERMAFENPCHR